MKRGKRGTDAEHTLAILGIVMWVAWTVLGRISLLTLVIGIVAFLLSISGYRRWRRRERVPSGSKEGEFIYPRWAWFGAGAVSATFVLGVVWALVLDISGRTYVAGEEPPLFVISGIVAWIAGGLVTERLLVRGAERREQAARTEQPPLPPPPPGSPPARDDEGTTDEERRRRNELASRQTPDRKQEPRAGF